MLAGADNFGIEQGKAGKAVEWMNSDAKKNGRRFEGRLSGYSMQTIKFGGFELIVWTGEWSHARNAIKKVSRKLQAKVVESGYHEKRDLLSAMFSGSAEYANVFSGGRLVGRIELEKKAGRWIAKSESFV